MSLKLLFFMIINIIYLFNQINCFNENPVIKIKIDSSKFYQIRGTTMPDYQKRNSFYAFLGIPFAKPPIGYLRFSVSTNTKNYQIHTNNLFVYFE